MECNEHLFARYDSPLGPLVLASDGEALTALRFSDDVDGLAAGEGTPVFGEVRRWLDAYFSGREPGFTPPLALHSTDFQLRVWHELLAVPYGATVSYGELARRIGCRSAQAVGGAVGRNPVSIIVPCHRVVGADGSLTGYAWGLDRKLRLLQLEGIAPVAPFMSLSV